MTAMERVRAMRVCTVKDTVITFPVNIVTVTKIDLQTATDSFKK